MIFGKLYFHILETSPSFGVISSRILKVGLQGESENITIIYCISPFSVKKKISVYISWMSTILSNHVNHHVYCFLFISFIY